jgi:hypothetical protein
MSNEEPRIREIGPIFSLISIKKDHPWISLWTIRFLQYFILFCIIVIPGYLLFKQFNLVPTGLENARYFLSAMVQAQAAIVTLVITLTLIAIQMATASYTPRVVEVMKKNPDMWFLLIIYLVTISYGLIVLKIVGPDPDPFLVSLVLILGVYTFSTLILYMWNTIALLRPDKVITMLVREINPKNIHQEKWNDDILQPVFDVIHASIMRYDGTTTGTGLFALFNRIQEILPLFDDKGKVDIVTSLIRHLQRTTIVTLKNDDEEILSQIIYCLQIFGIDCAENKNLKLLEDVIGLLEFIGIHAADKGLEYSIEGVAHALCEINTTIAENGLADSARAIAVSLGNITLYTAKKELLIATSEAGLALRIVSEKDSEKKFLTACLVIERFLWDIGIVALEKGSKEMIEDILIDIEVVGYNLVDNGMEHPATEIISALKSMSKLADDKGEYYVIPQIIEALREIGIHALDAKNQDLRHILKRIVKRLCQYFDTEVGSEDPKKALVALLSRDEVQMAKLIDDIKSELKPNEKNTFERFILSGNVEMWKCGNKKIELSQNDDGTDR